MVAEAQPSILCCCGPSVTTSINTIDHNHRPSISCVLPLLPTTKISRLPKPGYEKGERLLKNYLRSECTALRIDSSACLGLSCPPTAALYDQAYSISRNTIFTKRIQIPAPDLSADPKSLPPSQQWSDVACLQWANLARTPEARPDLRRVIQCNVDNDDKNKALNSTRDGGSWRSAKTGVAFVGLTRKME